jgi:hypothetical protein
MLKQRGIAMSLILSIVTFGIYGIVWMVKLSNELSAFNGEKIMGILEIILSVITFGVYGIYWFYKMGKKVVRAQQKSGQVEKDNSIIYALLGLFGLGFISVALLQSNVNTLAR